VFPFLVIAIIVLGLPTLYFAIRSREFRKFLAGAFFLSAGMQFYFYIAKVSIPLIGTSVVQSVWVGTSSEARSAFSAANSDWPRTTCTQLRSLRLMRAATRPGPAPHLLLVRGVYPSQPKPQASNLLFPRLTSNRRSN
jgi:hypothetical protein